jgi:hypothetical protein
LNVPGAVIYSGFSVAPMSSKKRNAYRTISTSALLGFSSNDAFFCARAAIAGRLSAHRWNASVEETTVMRFGFQNHPETRPTPEVGWQ